MDITYKSKVDTWLVLVILALTIIPIAPLLYSDFSITVFCIIATSLCLILSLIYSIRYIIEDEYLIIKYGFIFSQKVLIDEIRSISSTRTILSAPAASLDRLELRLEKNVVVVSPKDKMGFIRSLQKLCSHEIRISIDDS